MVPWGYEEKKPDIRTQEAGSNGGLGQNLYLQPEDKAEQASTVGLFQSFQWVLSLGMTLVVLGGLGQRPPHPLTSPPPPRFLTYNDQMEELPFWID